MSEPAQKPASYSDLLALPDTVIGEILAGELHTQPRPANPHAFAASGLGMDIGGPFQRGRGGPGGWFIIFEPELHLGAGPDIVVSDLAGWKRSRMPSVSNEAHFELAPDWVCEIVSPGSVGRDRTIKLRIYLREKVPFYWIVDPVGKTLEVLRLDGESYRIEAVYTGSASVRAQPFDAVELDLGALWVSEEVSSPQE